MIGRLISQALADPRSQQPITVAFRTCQGARHPGRGGGYRNEVVSIRAGAAVGSCAIEPGTGGDDLFGLTGRPVADGLRHPDPAIRLAALDAFLLAVQPHESDPAAEAVRLPAGDSLARSLARAHAVAGLLPPEAERVAVVGVVNSLLQALRDRGVGYVPCDLKGGSTEWGEPIVTDAVAAADGADALLVSGMTLGNGTFEALAATGKPIVLFAQSGSAVARALLGQGVTAVSAEPFPFFWLTGSDSQIFLYRSAS
ncbi:Rossmann-like domain-containing protein [Longispora albida]|uniref:Rossmann-like domain-containing protein n=1 Tax=Longispora albida TaxID=203523 RepID=UPI00037A2A0F|nr:DUF364 domain-containing protein [Longispora albida]